MCLITICIAHLIEQLVINSSTCPYRTEYLSTTWAGEYERQMGGAYANQHAVGEADDIFIPKTAYTDWNDNKAHTDKPLAEHWFSWLQANTDFDQLIIETSMIVTSGYMSLVARTPGRTDIRF